MIILFKENYNNYVMDLPAYRRKKKGVPVSFIQHLTPEDLESHKDYINENECIFCLEDLKKESCLKSSGCRHIFHESCIREWLKNKGKCPTCMCLINSRFMIKVYDVSSSSS